MSFKTVSTGIKQASRGIGGVRRTTSGVIDAARQASAQKQANAEQYATAQLEGGAAATAYVGTKSVGFAARKTSEAAAKGAAKALGYSGEVVVPNIVGAVGKVGGATLGGFGKAYGSLKKSAEQPQEGSPEQYASNQFTSGAASTARSGAHAVKSTVRSGASTVRRGVRSARDAHKAVKRTNQTAQTTQKAAKGGVKATQTTIKTAKTTTKAAAKTTSKAAQTTKRAVQSIMQNAPRVARATATAVKAVGKAIVAAGKAAVAAVKAIVADIASGGTAGLVVVAIIIIVFVIIAIFSLIQGYDDSSSSANPESGTVSKSQRLITAEWNSRVSSIAEGVEAEIEEAIRRELEESAEEEDPEDPSGDTDVESSDGVDDGAIEAPEEIEVDIEFSRVEVLSGVNSSAVATVIAALQLDSGELVEDETVAEIMSAVLVNIYTTVESDPDTGEFVLYIEAESRTATEAAEQLGYSSSIQSLVKDLEDEGVLNELWETPSAEPSVAN